jgi:hypothetical protein
MLTSASLCVLLGGCTAVTSSSETLPESVVASGQAQADSRSVLTLTAAVVAYSRDYYAGESSLAFALLSHRCQRRVGRRRFTSAARAAAAKYGPQPSPRVSIVRLWPNRAHLNFVEAVTALDGFNQAWVLENGWKNDGC